MFVDNEFIFNQRHGLMDINLIFLEKWKSLKQFDRNLIIYWLLLSIIVFIFQQNFKSWIQFILLHGVLSVILFFSVSWLDRQENVLLRFIRYWYIIFAFPFLYWDVGPLLHIVFAGEFDPVIINIDTWMFGMLPNIWVQQYVSPILTEILQISYGIYWVTIPLGGAIFYLNKKYDLYERLLHYVTLTFFVSCFCFIFFPVAGPRFYITDQITANYQGLFLTSLLRNFVNEAAYRGGAFPSSHVAIALVILIFVWNFKPKTAIFLFLPLVTALSLATIYGQYHYFTDVLAGFILAMVIGFRGAHKTKNQPES
jgi:membrane-associated phospholipid phosphatase